MHQYKIIARILLTLPIINFAFALPLETHQVRGDVVPRTDVAITMLAKRAGEITAQGGMYFERLSGKPDSDIAGLNGPLPEAPVQGSMDPSQVDTSKIQHVSSAGPELSKSLSEAPSNHYPDSSGSEASLNHYLESSGSEASFNHYLESPGSEASLKHYMVSPKPIVTLKDLLLSSPPRGKSSASSDDSGYMSDFESMKPGKSKSKSLLKSLVGKLNKVKFWRRISGTGSTGIRDAVNTVQKGLKGLVDTGT